MGKVAKIIECKIGNDLDISKLLNLKNQKIMNFVEVKNRVMQLTIIFKSEKRAIKNIKAIKKMVESLEVIKGE